jgi:hypothetical protein
MPPHNVFKPVTYEQPSMCDWNKKKRNKRF